VPDEQDPHSRVEGHAEDCDEPDWRPTRTIADYFNGAGVDVREDQGEIDVWISVGDPRGAFVMRLELVEMDDGPELRLSVPHPGMPFLHMPLTKLASEGYYRIR
jgi:hypothetical protein